MAECVRDSSPVDSPGWAGPTAVLDTPRADIGSVSVKFRVCMHTFVHIKKDRWHNTTVLVSHHRHGVEHVCGTTEVCAVAPAQHQRAFGVGHDGLPHHAPSDAGQVGTDQRCAIESSLQHCRRSRSTYSRTSENSNGGKRPETPAPASSRRLTVIATTCRPLRDNHTNCLNPPGHRPNVGAQTRP